VTVVSQNVRRHLENIMHESCKSNPLYGQLVKRNIIIQTYTSIKMFSIGESRRRIITYSTTYILFSKLWSEDAPYRTTYLHFIHFQKCRYRIL